MEVMQFGHALERILCEILLADPAFGPVYLIKLDISDGFYHIAVNIDDIPKLGMVYPTPLGAEPLIAFPLVLPMGWTNSPPIFSTATETVADLANMRLHQLLTPLPHHLDALAASIPSPPPAPPPDMSLLPHIDRDPSLPSADHPLAYNDVFVNLTTAPIEQIQQARFASLTFTNQKNGVRGEVIGLARSGNPYLHPILSIIRRVLYLRQHSAPSNTPLTRVFSAP